MSLRGRDGLPDSPSLVKTNRDWSGGVEELGKVGISPNNATIFQERFGLGLKKWDVNSRLLQLDL